MAWAALVLILAGSSTTVRAQPLDVTTPDAGAIDAAATPPDPPEADPPADPVPAEDLGDAGLAGEEDLTPIEELDLAELLDPVVTSSGGIAEERRLAAANVLVVTADDIARHGWRSLAEVLASVPGLYLVDDLVIPSIGVRGVTGGLRAGTRLVKVMINGVPVNFRPDLTAFLGPELIPIETVERIEVVQGPLSALYGANAFIATVNVITRGTVEGTHGAIAGRVNVVQDNFGGGASLLASRRSGQIGVLAAAGLDYIDRSGVRLQPTFPAQDPSLERYRPFFEEPTSEDVATPISLYAALEIGDPEVELGRVTLQGGHQRLDAMGELQINSAFTHQSRHAIANSWANLRYERRWERFSLSGEVGYATGAPTRDYRLFLTENNNSYYEPRFDYRSVMAGVAASWSPLDDRLSLRLAVDGELDRETVLFYRQTFLVPTGGRMPGDSIDLIAADKRRTQLLTDFGVSLQITSVPEIDALPGLRLAGNVRADFIGYGDLSYPVELSWRAGIVYEWSRSFVTKLIAGRAFQTPSGVQLFARPGFGTANNVLGNLGLEAFGIDPLRPQSVTGGELIVSGSIAEHLKVDGSLFYQSVEDTIAFRVLANDLVAENGPTTRAAGVLLSVRGGADWLEGYATLSAQRSIVDGQLSDDPPPAYPNYFGTAGLNLDVDPAHLRLNVHLRWAGERGANATNVALNNRRPYTLPAYALLDATLGTTGIQLLGEGTETVLTASVRNLLDERHAEAGHAGFDFTVLGRTFWFEARQVF